MDKSILVYVDLEGTTHFVGRLWTRNAQGQGERNL
jgi:hypothetical protein